MSYEDGALRRRDMIRALLFGLGSSAIAGIAPAACAQDAERADALSHPNLFFDASDVEALRERCRGPMRSQLEMLIAYGEAHLDESPPSALHGGYEKRGDAIQDPFLSHVLAFSLLYVATGSDRYLAPARRWALGLAELPELVGEIRGDRCASCGYPEGWAVTALAVAYDWLYASFDASERTLLRDKIRVLTKVLYDATYKGEWWTGAYLHHDTWIPIGGLGIGAMSILGEVEGAAAWAERAREELTNALDWLDADGAWPEGPCGWAFAMASAVPFWAAYGRRSRAIVTSSEAEAWLEATWKFRLYSRTPDGQFLGFGDCSSSGGYQTSGFEGAGVLRYLAARYRNPYAQWLASREWEKRPNPYTAVWEIVWMDPSVPEAPPDDLPHGALFENQAMAFLLTGWDASSTNLAFRGTALLGRRATSLYRPGKTAEFNNSTTHVHADANSFAIWSRGEFAITMARYGQRETEFQNSLLVDGQGQYATYGDDHVGRPEGRITRFFSSRDAGLVAADAAGCYPPGLERFVRTLFLIEPGVVFVHDDVAAASPVELEWRLHVDQNASVEIHADGFASTLNGTRTIVRLVRPRGVDLGERADDNNRAVGLRLNDRTTDAELVAVVLPSIHDGTSASIAMPTERSFEIQALGATILAVFSPARGVLEIPYRLSADGAAAIAWTSRGAMGFVALEASALVVDGRALFEASVPITASLAKGRLTIEAASAGTIAVLGASGERTHVSFPEGASTHDV